MAKPFLAGSRVVANTSTPSLDIVSDRRRGVTNEQLAIDTNMLRTSLFQLVPRVRRLVFAVCFSVVQSVVQSVVDSKRPIDQTVADAVFVGANALKTRIAPLGND
ncbi:hypothetical protein AB1L42_05680 [Thalassoglobus sp. JC818]|uniref:hypothetical protein n=1 Tax=Thalassoglobus sp. JC818 TaxID=3232136 RepID=UPI00345B4326